jgi:hypothetical protein
MKKALTPQEEEDKQNTDLLGQLRRDARKNQLGKMPSDMQVDNAETALFIIGQASGYLTALDSTAEYLSEFLTQLRSSVSIASAVLTIVVEPRRSARKLHQLMTWPVGVLTKLAPGEDEPVDWAYIEFAEHLERIRLKFATLAVPGMEGSVEPLPTTQNAFEAVNQVLAAALEIERNLEGCERQVHGYYARFHFEDFQKSVLDQLESLEMD